MSNLIVSKVFKNERDKKEHKNRYKFFQERAKDCCIITLIYTYNNEKKTFFSSAKELIKRKSPVTQIRWSSYHNLSINTIKWYNFQSDMEIYENFERKEIKKETHLILSFGNYDNIRAKAFNVINEVDNIKLQIRIQTEKLKICLARSPFKVLNIFA